MDTLKQLQARIETLEEQVSKKIRTILMKSEW